MEHTYQLFPCELKIPCDTFQCHGRAEYFIGKPSAPKNTLTKVCGKCAGELIDSAVGIAANESKAGIITGAITNIDASVITTGTINADALLPFEPESPIEVIEIDGKPITDMTVKELKAVCKKLGLSGYSDKKEAELIAMIDEATDSLEAIE